MPVVSLNRFTGLFRGHGFATLRAHDPWVEVWSGSVANRDFADRAAAVGGAGLTEASAELAGIGEAIERWSPHALPADALRRDSYRTWSGTEPAVAPAKWVLFSEAQYRQSGFPFEPLAAETECDWVCFRSVATGSPRWVPAALAFLDLRPQAPAPRFAPMISTGWSAGRDPDVVLLRGIQEVIERDALVGAWWQRYPLLENRAEDVFAMLPGIAERVCRPNLLYRFYRVVTPWSAHVTLATVTGPDSEGELFAIGSACRETRAESYQKALLEAIQGRHYVRFLAQSGLSPSTPSDFAEHAIYYTRHRERLAKTVLDAPDFGDATDDTRDTMHPLLERLPQEPLFRWMTPPAFVATYPGWLVLRIMIPGLQPLHGHHSYPFLGGPLWAGRPLPTGTRFHLTPSHDSRRPTR